MGAFNLTNYFTPEMGQLIDADILRQDGAVKFLVSVFYKMSAEKMTKLNSALETLTTPKNLDIITKQLATGKAFHSELLQTTLAREFPRLGKNNAVGGQLLQKVVLYVFRLKPKLDSVEKSFKGITTLINLIYPNIKTRQGIYSDFRGAIQTKYGASSKLYKASRKDLAISHTEFIQTKEQTILRRDEANEDRKQYDIQDIVNIMNKLAPSSKFEDEVILCQLAGGGRLIEVLRESTFEPVRNPHYIRVVNVAKKRTKKGTTEENEPFKIVKPLVVLNSTEFIKKINDLRKLSMGDPDSEDILNEEMTARFIGRINKRIKTLGLDATTHTLRKMYGNLSYEFFADMNKVSYNLWLKKVLGHTSSDTSQHYTSIKLTTEKVSVPAELVEMKSEIDTLAERLKQVEKPAKFPKNADPASVEFKLKDGSVVYVKKWIKKRDSIESKKERMNTLSAEMKSKGLKLTNFSGRRLGISKNYLSMYLRGEL